MGKDRQDMHQYLAEAMLQGHMSYGRAGDHVMPQVAKLKSVRKTEPCVLCVYFNRFNGGAKSGGNHTPTNEGASTDLCYAVQEARSDLYKKQKEASGWCLKLGAEANLYQKQKEAEADLFAKQKEAKGLEALAKAQGVYGQTLMKSFEGNYAAFRDYMMIKGRLLKDFSTINAQGIKGLNPRISIFLDSFKSSQEN